MWDDFNSWGDKIYKLLKYYNRVVIPFYIMFCLILNWCVVILICFLKNLSLIVLWRFFVMRWNRSDDFLKLNVNVFYLVSYYACKVEDILCTSRFMVPPPIIFILLFEVWLMGNLKSRYLHYKVSVNQFCDQEAIGLNPVISDLSVSCFYFRGGCGNEWK